MLNRYGILKIDYIKYLYRFGILSFLFKNLIFPLILAFILYWIVYFCVKKFNEIKRHSKEKDWKKDYEEFKKHNFFKNFDEVISWVHDSDSFDHSKEYKKHKDLIDYLIL